MAAGGKIPSFNEEEEDWDSYQERLECFFKVNKTDNEVKVAVLIMGLSARQYQIVKNLVAPDTPSDKGYTELIAIIQKHYGGGRNARAERTKFRNVFRKENESIQEYSVRLKQAVRHCKFDSNLDQMLVDQLIAGVRSPSITNKLFESTEGLSMTLLCRLKSMKKMQCCMQTGNLVMPVQMFINLHSEKGRSYCVIVMLHLNI